MTAAGTPLVSAIVLNWNGGDVASAAVASLLAQTLESLEVIVVDNASTDGSDAALERRFGARIALIRNAGNLGFAGGNNVGLRAARGAFAFLLNNDAEAPFDPEEGAYAAVDGGHRHE